MKDQIVQTIQSTGSIELAAKLFIIAAFVWAIAGAVVFVISKTRTKEIFGAKFDPEKPHTERRSRS